MSDRVQEREVGNFAPAPRPPRVQSRPGAAQPGNGALQLQRPGTSRATVRDALDTALHGIRLDGRDRRFLSRLVHWDKRNAAAVASLLWRARVAGRSEVALSGRQLEILLSALADAAAYRTRVLTRPAAGTARTSRAAAAPTMRGTPTAQVHLPASPRS